MSVKVKNFFLIWVILFSLLSFLVFFSSSFISSQFSKQLILNQISQSIGRPVKVGILAIRWHDLSPQLVIRNVSVTGGAGGGQLHFSSRVQVSLLRSVWQHRLVIRHINISAVKLDVWRNNLGHLIFSVNGKTPWLKSNNASFISRANLLGDTPKGGITISNSQINWYQHKKPVMKLHLSSMQVVPQRQVVLLQANGILANHAQVALRSTINLVSDQPSVRYKLTAKHIAITPAMMRNKIIHNWLSIRGELGEGCVSLSGWWHKGIRKEVTLLLSFPNINVSQLVVKNTDHVIADFNLKPYRHLSAKIDLLRALNNAAVTVDYIDLKSLHRDLKLNHTSLSFMKNNNSWYLSNIKSHVVDFNSLYSWLAQAQCYRKVPSWIYALHLTGKLENLSLIWNKRGKFSRAQAELSGVSFASIGYAPGLRHLFGKVRYSSTRLVTQLHSNDLLVSAPKIFLHQHNYGRFHEESITHFYGHSWNTSFKKVYSQDGNLNLALHAFVSKQAGKSVVVNLLGHFTVKDLGHVQDYLPKKIMHEKLKKWLGMSLKKGNLQSGVVIWRGAIKDFPYYNKKNLFKISARLNQGVLHFSPQWPSLTAMQGKVIFHNDRMLVELQHALIQQYSVEYLRAHIGKFRCPLLFITAEGKGDFKDALSVLKQSPLAIKKQLSALFPRGSTHLNLSLGINLKHKAPVSVRGDVALRRVAITIPGADLSVKSIFGVVNFTTKTLSSLRLRATLLNHRFSTKISTIQKQGRSYISLHSMGAMTWSDLLRHYAVRASKASFLSPLIGSSAIDQSALVSGCFPVAVSLQIPFSHGVSTVLTIKTSLRGTSLAGLDEFTKSPSVSWPTKIRWILDPDHSSQMSLSTKNKFYVIAHYDKTRSLSLLNVFLGKRSSPPTLIPGIVVSGNIRTLDLNQLDSLCNRFHDFRHTASLYRSKLMDSAKVERLHIGELLYNSVSLHNLAISLMRKKSRVIVTVNSDLIRGSVQVPMLDGKPWLVSFSRFFLPKLKLSKALTNYSFLPAMRVDISHFYWRKQYYQQLSFSMQKNTLKKVFHLSHVLVKKSYYTLRASGDWCYEGKVTSHFVGDIVTDSFGTLLGQLKLNKLFKNGSGGVGFNVSWQGLPWQLKQQTAFGAVNLYSQYGYVIVGSKLQQSINALRLVTVLGVESLPKHMLTLFTDLANKGIEYNQFQANLLLNNGVLTLQRASFSGDNINLSLSGNINLVKKSLKLSMVVEPKLASSLPVLSGFIAGPAMAVGMYVLNKASGDTFGGATAHYYSVVGALDKPKIIEDQFSGKK